MSRGRHMARHPAETRAESTIMTSSQLFECISDQVCQMDRAALIDRLTHFEHMRLDFTPEYLAKVPTEKMRHLLAAALWRTRTRDER